jgi:hypothetical protein
MKTKGEMTVQLYELLTSELHGNELIASRCGRFTTREGTLSTHCIREWVGPTVYVHVLAHT